MTSATARLAEVLPMDPSMSVLGVRIDMVSMELVLRRIHQWVGSPEPRMVFLRDVASLMLAVDSPDLRQLHDDAALVLPDGMPLVWLGRLRGYGARIGRVTGTDLLEEVAASSTARPIRHYFYGGGPGIAQALTVRLMVRHPNVQAVGTLTPPMRAIGPDYRLDEAALAEIEAIRATRPDIVWVGLSSPKQEFWIREASRALGTGVLVGVGAAFDFHAGSKRRAPRWMRDTGLEWLHRLMSEPRRLWYRYLVLAPRFVLALAWELLASRRNRR